MVILSTRNHGIPTKLYPIIFDFNYVIVKVTINDKSYFLDATSKFLPFGQLPVRCLNGEARIINYKKESNWTVLKPIYKTYNRSTAKLILSEEGELSGNLLIHRNGYYAISQREEINSTNQEDYLEEFESKNPDIEVEEYKVINKEVLEKPLTENFKIIITLDEGLTNKTRINPFLFNRITKNPFKLKERNYPVDFAYPRKNNYALNLQIPDNYKVTKLPENLAISLPNKGGVFILKSTQKGNIINIYVRMNTNKKIYSSEEYHYLKEFFKKIIIAENQYIILEKK